MYTLTGKNIEVGGDLPSYRDIATCLARIPRWAGATLIPWSVLQHTLMMARIAADWHSGSFDILLALWHDAHEFATGDIPFPFKTSEQRKLQHEIQEWLSRGLLPFCWPEAKPKWLDILDRAAAWSEAHVLCHPRVRNEPTVAHEDLVQMFGSIPPDTFLDPIYDLYDMPEREQKQEFIRLTKELCDEVAV